MAEAISGISKNALRVGASFFGGKFDFNVSNDNVEVAKELIEEVANDVVKDVAKDTVKKVCETVTKLGVLYVSYKLLRRIIDAAIKKSFGGDRNDQDPPDTRPGCLHVELHCLTDERFLEVLAEYESGRMKERLQEEFSLVGIKVEGLKVKIENMEEVNETKEAIKKRQLSRITKDPDEMTMNIETDKHGGCSVNRCAMATIDLQENTNSFTGGDITFAIRTNKVDVAKEVCTTTFGALYAACRSWKPVVEGAVAESLGGKRDDQDVRDIRLGSLHVDLHCFTNIRFLEVLADYESGRMKERFQEELSLVGIKVEGLKVEIENMDEVNKTKEAIKKRY